MIMGNEHIALIRLLIAAQVAVVEHADEDLRVNQARDALVAHLTQALKLAKKLDN